MTNAALTAERLRTERLLDDAASRAVRQEARQRGVHPHHLLCDSLGGDLARMSVFRRLRRSFPAVEPTALHDAIDGAQP